MKKVAALLWLVASFSFTTYAQSPNASLSGRVTDVSKAVIVDARILAVNVGTNIGYEGATNSAGEYYVPNLLPGTYRIEARKTGFNTVIEPDIVLHVQEEVEINFEMVIGSVSQSVTVKGGAPMVELSTSAPGTVVDSTTVRELPLNGVLGQTWHYFSRASWESKRRQVTLRRPIGATAASARK